MGHSAYRWSLVFVIAAGVGCAGKQVSRSQSINLLDIAKQDSDPVPEYKGQPPPKEVVKDMSGVRADDANLVPSVADEAVASTSGVRQLNIKSWPPSWTKPYMKSHLKELARYIHDLRANQEHRKLEALRLKKGDTLQRISHRLYHNVRFWPELYVININKLNDYDLIPANSVIHYFSHRDLREPASRK